jgi:hypothetical protein
MKATELITLTNSRRAHAEHVRKGLFFRRTSTTYDRTARCRRGDLGHAHRQFGRHAAGLLPGREGKIR